MIGLDRARNILAHVGWLSEQPEAFKAEVFRRSILMRFAPGDVIYRLGDPLGGVYGLVAGAVSVSTGPPVATPLLLHVQTPGSWIGEACFLVREPRRVELAVTVEAWLMHLPLEAMDQIARDDPLTVRRFTKMLMYNVDILIRAFYDLQNPDHDQRVALALLRVVSKPGSLVPLSQAELGVMSNAQRQQVNAALRQFAAKGWVKKGYRSVTVEDVAGLRRFAEKER